MPKDQYFRPRNWSKFQSRSNNSMAWVKNHTALLQDPGYLDLTALQRAVLHGVWLLCGVRGRPLPLVSSYCGRALALRSQDCGPALEVLLSRNFIELCGATENLHGELPHLEEIREEEKRKKERKKGTPPTKPVSENMLGKETNGQKIDTPAKSDITARGTRFPDDWRLPKEWADWAWSQGHQMPELEGDKFRDYWIAQPGAKGRKADWFATWRNWIRRSLGDDRRGPSKKKSTDETRQHRRSGIAAAVAERLGAGAPSAEGEG